MVTSRHSVKHIPKDTKKWLPLEDFTFINISVM